MGGATIKRIDNSIALLKTESQEPGKYGDPIGNKIIGVQTTSIQVLTRLHQWRIEKGVVISKEELMGKAARRSRGSDSDREAALAALPPWSSVNNCTQ